jgi:iron complex transport system permease protein
VNRTVHTRPADPPAQAGRTAAGRTAAKRTAAKRTGAARSPGGRFSVRMHHRPVLTGAALAAVAAALGIGSLCWGSAVGIGDTLATMFGAGSPVSDLVVFQIRMPRALAGLLVGAYLGVAGAQFQNLTRNPLGSPDLVGFTSGAATGAVLVILVFGEQAVAVSTGAIGFGLVTAAIMYLLAWRRGVQGVRLVLIGVAVSTLLRSVTDYLLIRADIDQSQAAHLWLVGSLSTVTWDQVRLLALAGAVLLPAAVVLIRPLDQLGLGDEVAMGLGVPVERVRIAVIATAVGLSGVAVAAVGPIAFVALAAPQVARRLAGSTGAGVVPAGLTGAVLLSAADLVARSLPLHGQLPVGVVTGGLGGCYLTWLLWREHRTGRA